MSNSGGKKEKVGGAGGWGVGSVGKKKILSVESVPEWIPPFVLVHSVCSHFRHKRDSDVKLAFHGLNSCRESE